MPPGYVSIDGPAPLAPVYSLLTAARRVDEGDDRWINGAGVWPYPCGQAAVRNPCRASSGGAMVLQSQQPAASYDTMEVSIGFQCLAAGLDFQAFAARARAVFEAIEASAVEGEFAVGTQFVSNPVLTKGTPVILNGGTATSPRNGLALLENHIAAKGRRGMLHATPGLISSLDLQVEKDGQNLQTRYGTRVVPGGGYVGPFGVAAGGGVAPPTGAAATGTQEWVYATGAVEYRASELHTLPDSPADGLDRSSNQYTVWVQRDYLVTWDQCIHAAVKIDRCQTAC